MTEPDPMTGPGRRLLHDAVRALTAAGRLERGPDFAEFLTLALAAAAANLGGMQAALARRPGSWEAEQVRGMLLSPSGKTPTVCWRTAPNR